MGILPLSMPGISVTVILGFIFCWNAFDYSLMLAGRQTFPVTVGAIQFISYEQVLWGQMAAATIVAALPQLVLSLMVQKKKFRNSFAASPWARCDRRGRWSRSSTYQVDDSSWLIPAAEIIDSAVSGDRHGGRRPAIHVFADHGRERRGCRPASA